VASRNGAGSRQRGHAGETRKDNAFRKCEPSKLNSNPPQATALVPWDNARRALSEARTMYEAKSIRDVAVAMEVWAKQAKNHEMEADAIALRMNASRKLGQLMAAQKETVGLAKGGKPYQGKSTGLAKNPVATLAMQGVDKTLAHQARLLWALDDVTFENKVQDARRSAGRVFRRLVRKVEIVEERQERRTRTAQGGSVADLHALIASGFRASVIAADPPWRYGNWSDRAHGAASAHYDTMPLDAIKALPVSKLAAEDCALFLWVTWPLMPVWNEVIEAWGFTYSSRAFDWVKLNPNGEGYWVGMGFGTRGNSEPCLLARRGSPLRLDECVHSVITAPRREHSEKPDEAYARMKRLYGGPYLELFARKPRDGWTTWGNEVPTVKAAE
jgi:N6-adenosine-specific RNA methylase IME4